MPINGSELIDNPMDTIFSPFVDLLGPSFWLIPLTFITIALYVKTRDTVIVSIFMIGSGVLLSSGSIFAGYPEMALAYMIFSGLGIVGLIAGIFFMRK
jgi:hypothetical protein